MTTSQSYNPLDYENLGRSVITALLSQDAKPLGALNNFLGAGVYAIYYLGGYPAYVPITARNRDGKFSLPIYVGKAIPKGARKGGRGSGAVGSPLFDRLCEHSESIACTKNLQLEDFYCRYLVVDDVWIPLAEAMLIEGYQPLWNIVVEGFGNHDPGSGRYLGQRPKWDMLHPGRSWANKLHDHQMSVAAILAQVQMALANLS